MPLWGSKDQAVTVTANTTVETTQGAPIGTRSLVNAGGGANAHFGNTAGTRASVDLNMFGNTTANAFVTGKTVGIFGVDAQEIANTKMGISHTGWNVRTVGSGGRAGRVTWETLVAGGITTDANTDNTILP